MFNVYITDSDLIARVLELVIKKEDVDFIKCLVTEQGVDVNGEPFVYTQKSTIQCFS